MSNQSAPTTAPTTAAALPWEWFHNSGLWCPGHVTAAQFNQVAGDTLEDAGMGREAFGIFDEADTRHTWACLLQYPNPDDEPTPGALLLTECGPEGPNAFIITLVEF